MHSRLSDFIEARAAETYAEPRTTGHDGLTAQMAPLVAAHLPKGADILDIGPGQGPALEWFNSQKKRDFYAVGLTPNKDDADACEALGFEIFRQDMHNMNMPRSFDCVWARHVLEHSVIPFFVLHEFSRVLKPGGILYAEVPSPGTDCRHEANPNHYSVLTCGMWLQLIQRAGFKILEVREITLNTAAGPDIYHSIIARKSP